MSIQDVYRELQQSISTQKLCVLEIADEQTLLALSLQQVLSLPIGAIKTSSAFFHHEPPTPEEIEAAINVIEDELMKIVKSIDVSSVLYTQDPEIKNIAELAGFTAKDGSLSRDDMETLFGRFAEVVMGHPMHMANIPVDRKFAATLLILREIMHHLGFTRIFIY